MSMRVGQNRCMYIYLAIPQHIATVQQKEE